MHSRTRLFVSTTTILILATGIVPCALAGSIKILQPTNGQVLQAGSTYTVQWSGDVPANAQGSLHLYKGEDPASYIAWVDLAAHQFDWHICPTIGNGNDYRLRLIYLSASAEAFSDGTFEITGSVPPTTLALTSHNDGGVVQGGTWQRVTWSVNATEGWMEIDLVHAGQSEFITGYIDSVPASRGFFDWFVCPSLVPADDYQIRLVYWECDRRVTALSARPFSIQTDGSAPAVTQITSPSGGATLTAGAPLTITWASSHPEGSVSITLSSPENPNAVTVGHAEMAANSWSGVLCDSTPEGAYQVSISWLTCDGRYASVLSDPVQVVGGIPRTLELLGIRAGEILPTGGRKVIAWQGQNLPEKTAVSGVQLSLRRDGIDYDSFNSNELSPHSAQWVIPRWLPSGSNYQIKGTVRSCSGSIDAFSEPFTIVDGPPPPAITLLWPSAGEVLQAGQTYTFTWSCTESTANVVVSLQSMQGYGVDLGRAPARLGHLTAMVCDVPPGEEYHVSLYVYTNTDYLGDESDGFITVEGSRPPPVLSITSPISDQTTWESGTNQTVTWNSSEGRGWVDATLERRMESVYLGGAPASAGSVTGLVHVYENAYGPGFKLRLTWSDCGQSRHVTAPGLITIVPSTVPPPHLVFTGPTTGSVLQAGTRQTITWTGENLPESIYMEVFKGSSRIAEVSDYHGVRAADGHFAWDVCAIGEDGSDYTIRTEVCNLTGCEKVSTGPFSIVGGRVAPALRLTNGLAGQSIPVGSDQMITWESTNATGDVELVLAQEGIVVGTIGTTAMSANHFPWHVCPLLTAGECYVVHLHHPDCPAPVDSFVEGDPTFTITAPTGVESLFDLNGDCRVDEGDIEIFKACASGPGISAYSTEMLLACPLTRYRLGPTPVDYDQDSDVDMDDFGELQRHFTAR